MKKLSLLVGTGILVALFAGCGPKKATKETMSQIEECRKAEESANQKIAELNAQIKELQSENLDSKIQSLQHERDSLKNYLELLEKGY